MTGRISWGLILLLLGGSLFFSFQPDKISSNIFGLLPEQHSRNIPQQAIDDYSEQLSRKHLFLVSAPDMEQAVTKAKWLYQQLKQTTLFAEINFRLSEQELKSIYTTYAPYHFSLLSAEDQTGLQQQPADWLAEKLVRNIVSPVTGMNSSTIKSDPFALYHDFLASLPAGNQRAQIIDGYTTFHGNDRVYILINCVLSASAFGNTMQEGFARLTALIDNNQKEQSEILSFGVIRYALKNRVLAEREISTIGIGSMLGIILIFALVFRRFLVMAIVLLPISVGMLTAFSVSLLLFDDMHLVSLVFGASLIGVSIDYTLHYCCSNSTLTSCRNGQQALAHVRSALTIGLISSSLGYLTLAIADFPALRQMAVMAIAGLAGAYFTVLFWLPALIKRPLVVNQWIANWSTALTSRLQKQHPIPVTVILLSIAVVFAVNLYIKQGEDNIKLMQAKLTELDRIDQTLKSIIGEFPNSQFFLVHAKSSAELLEVEQQLVAELQHTGEQQSRVMALSRWLPDPLQQQKNHELLKQVLNEEQQLKSKLDAAGLPADLVNDYLSELRQSSPLIMNLDTFLNSPLGKLQRHLWLGRIDEQYYSIVSLHGFTELDKLSELASKWPAVEFIDRSASVSSLFRKYRQIIEKMFPLVLLSIFALLAFRFGIKDSVRVVSAPTLSALLSFLCLNLIMGTYNLFSIFGLIITVAISIDYAVFIRESSGYNKSTYLAITLAGLTTVLALGLLSLSQTPALSSFGLSLLLGVIFSYLLTPLIVYPRPEGRS